MSDFAGTRVFVYWNLHRSCWSVRALAGPDRGRVVAHVSQILLSDVTGRVGAAGRLRVIREGKKNVHAGLVGYVVASHPVGHAVSPVTSGSGITYNPYRDVGFVYRTETREPFTGSTCAMLTATEKGPSVMVGQA